MAHRVWQVAQRTVPIEASRGRMTPIASGSTVTSTTKMDSERIGGRQITAVVLCVLVTLIEGTDLTLLPVMQARFRDVWSVSQDTWGTILTCGVVGTIVGGLLMGWLGDRFGRRNSLITAMLVMTGITYATTFCATVPQLMTARFIGGIAFGWRDSRCRSAGCRGLASEGTRQCRGLRVSRAGGWRRRGGRHGETADDGGSLADTDAVGGRRLCGRDRTGDAVAAGITPLHRGPHSRGKPSPQAVVQPVRRTVLAGPRNRHCTAVGDLRRHLLRGELFHQLAHGNIQRRRQAKWIWQRRNHVLLPGRSGRRNHIAAVCAPVAGHHGAAGGHHRRDHQLHRDRAAPAFRLSGEHDSGFCVRGYLSPAPSSCCIHPPCSSIPRTFAPRASARRSPADACSAMCPVPRWPGTCLAAAVMRRVRCSSSWPSRWSCHASH